MATAEMATAEMAADIGDDRGVGIVVATARPRCLDRMVGHGAAGRTGQHDDAIGEVGRLLDVVRHEQDGLARRLPDSGELVLQAFARDGVEGGERFVHQQHFGLDGKRARQRHPLPLTARELMRPAPGEVGKAHDAQGVERLGVPLGAGETAPFETESDIVDHPPPGQQARVLEHQRDRLTLGRLRVEAHRAGTRLGEADQHTQQSGLADARRADDGDEGAARNGEVEPLQHVGAAAVALEGEAKTPDVDHAFHRSNHLSPSRNNESSRP